MSGEYHSDLPVSAIFSNFSILKIFLTLRCPYFGVACPEPLNILHDNFTQGRHGYLKKGFPNFRVQEFFTFSKFIGRSGEILLYLWLSVALKDKTENLNKYKDISSCQSNDAFIYGVSGKSYCILIKEWEWEKQIEPYYQEIIWPHGPLFPVSRAPEVPKLYFFSPKKFCVFITYVFLGFGCGESSQLQEKRLLFLAMCTGFSLQWRALYCRAQTLHYSALQLQGLRSCGSQVICYGHGGSFQTRGWTLVSPALQGELLTAGTPGKPMNYAFRITHLRLQFSKRTDAARIFQINILDV